MENNAAIINLAMNCMGVALTIIDMDGKLLYYNKRAAEILDRKPEYIGKEIYSHHLLQSSNKKVASMIHDFEKGRVEPFRYKAKPYGKSILVTLAPLMKNNHCIGCVQSVMLQKEIDSFTNNQ